VVLAYVDPFSTVLELLAWFKWRRVANILIVIDEELRSRISFLGGFKCNSYKVFSEYFGEN
jgi:hypothetical protein